MEKNASIVSVVMLVLAAGLSTRMGREKPFLPWKHHQTLLDHQLDVVEAGGLIAIPVVQRPVEYLRVAVNLHPEQGLSESLKVGLGVVRQHFPQSPVGVLLVDQPFVTAEDIRRVAQGFADRPLGIHAMRARYRDVPGHPVIFDKTWDPVVQALSGDAGLGTLWRERKDVLWVDLAVSARPDPAYDLDTEEAYQQALQWGSEGGEA